MSSVFRVAYTADFLDAEGQPRFRDYGLDAYREFAEVEVAPLGEHLPEISADQLADFQAVIVLASQVTERTFENSDNLLAIGRFGVGYDNVDVAACTAHDVVATITRGAVDRPVAEATVGWMLALSHHVLMKHTLLRDGRWDDRTNYMGTELRDRTLGIVGCGGIGRALLGLLKSFGMNQPLVFDPYLPDDLAAELQVNKVSLDKLVREADYVSVNCPLNDETRDLIGANELAQMKPTAYLINTARGGIVNEDALFAALSEGQIAGAALDCFDGEPITSPHRFGTLPNVLLAPHSIAWTHELFRDIGRVASQSMIDLAFGRPPHGVINPEVLERPSFQDKWRRLQVG